MYVDYTFNCRTCKNSITIWSNSRQEASVFASAMGWKIGNLTHKCMECNDEAGTMLSYSMQSGDGGSGTLPE